MTYLHYIGIDVSKNWFDLAHFSEKTSHRYDNDAAGIVAFLNDNQANLAQGFIVLEATGGYETALLHALCAQNIAVHRASGFQTRYFANSLGKKSKTDALDAHCLARYAFERHDVLALYVPPSAAQSRFMALTSRRDDLIAMRVQEQNRVQHEAMRELEAFFAPLMMEINKAIEQIEVELAEIVQNDEEMSLKATVLTEISGIGTVTAHILLSHLPELGRLTRRQVASLAGLAPHERTSGKKKGNARVFGGRTSVKTALYRAVWSASRFNKQIKPFYDALLAQGKPKMVALCACARKLLVIANAKIRDKIFQIQPDLAMSTTKCG
jgi:transposase